MGAADARHGSKEREGGKNFHGDDDTDKNDNDKK